MKWAWLGAWVLAGALFWGFWSYGLFDLDEGIYAAALAEMRRANEWVVVTFRGEPFFEKPILIYWLGLLFTKVGLPGVVALRIGSVAASLGTLAIVSRFLKRHVDERTALAAFVALSTCSWFVVMGRMFTPDAVLVFAMTASFVCLYNSFRAGAKWRLLSFAMLGVAVLAKGPMPAFIFLVLLGYSRLFLRQDLQDWKGGWVGGVVGFIAIVSTWYVPVALREGGSFFTEFIVRQNLGRLGGGDTAHLGPFYYYLPVLVVAFIPLSMALCLGFKRKRSPLERYLVVWAGAILLLFSVSGSKLPHYILPAMPPLAMLLAIWTDRRSAAVSVAMLIFTLLVVVGVAIGSASDRPIDLKWVLVGSIVGALLSFAAWLRRCSLPLQAVAAGAPIMLSLTSVAPLWWRYAQADADSAARYLAGRTESVIEYRTGGEGKSGQTAMPSMLWVMDRETTTCEDVATLSTLLGPPSLILTRERRLFDDLAIARLPGIQLREVASFGRFQIVECATIP